MEGNSVRWFVYTTLFCRLFLLFGGTSDCKGLLNNGTYNRRFLPGTYADGALCSVGQVIDILESCYLALSMDNDTNEFNSTANPPHPGCREVVNGTHQRLVSTCEHKIACDDMLIPAYNITCDGHQVYADYFDVVYDCLETDKTKRDLYSLACKDDAHQVITCKDNEVIVKDLLLGYKRRDTTCSTEIEQDDCLVHYNSERLNADGFNAQRKFIEKCSSRSSCDITAAEFNSWNITCGTETRDSANDFFLVIYECGIVPRWKTICNGDEINLDCSEENIINITSAWYTFFPHNETCLGDDRSFLKRCRLQEWTVDYHNKLLVHCDMKTSCDGGIIAKPAPIPGTCYNGQFSIEENRTTDAVIIEYTCIPGKDLSMINTHNEDSEKTGYTYIFVGIILAVTMLIATGLLVAFVRRKMIRRRPNKRPKAKTILRKSAQYYENVGAASKNTPSHDKTSVIYAEPILPNRTAAAAPRSSTRYSGNEYSEIMNTKTVGDEGGRCRNILRDDSNLQSQVPLYAKVNKPPGRYDELELFDNTFYERCEGK